MKKYNKSAFSLVEISIILLIIGLIAAVISGQTILQNAKLSNAATLTQTSGIDKIPDLLAWYETSVDDSFKPDENANGINIGIWYNRNLKQEIRNDATQTSLSSQPLFTEKVFLNAIPALRFDGTNDFFSIDGSLLIGNSYTVFVVEQRRSSAVPSPFLGAIGNTSNQNLFLGYSSDTAIGYSQFEHDSAVTFTVAAYSTPTPTIHSFMLNNVAGMRYWRNGATNVTASNAATASLSALSQLGIGRFSQDNGSTVSYYNGDIAEIIIFKRSLKTDEKRAVEYYLGKKYAITIGGQ